MTDIQARIDKLEVKYYDDINVVYEESVSIIKELQAQLSAKDAIIQRYEFKKDDESKVRACIFRDLEILRAAACKEREEKDALIAEQKENEWQPIATMPRLEDMSFLIFISHKTDEGHSITQVSWFEGRLYPDAKENLIAWQDGIEIERIIAWKKLPEPPKGI